MFFRAGRKEIVNLKWIERVDVGIGGGLVATAAAEGWRCRSGNRRDCGRFSASNHRPPRFPQWPLPCMYP